MLLLRTWAEREFVSPGDNSPATFAYPAVMIKALKILPGSFDLAMPIFEENLCIDFAAATRDVHANGRDSCDIAG
jgi:hypothetical protein